MRKNFEGKTVVITGASSGIGLALAHAFGQAGATIVANGRNPAKLEAAAEELRREGITVHPLPGDLAQWHHAEALAAAAMEKTGRIDVLVNNAGISMRALFAQVQLEVIEQVMAINFWGTVHCTKACLPHLLASQGSIVAISSIAGLRGLPARTGYSASKAAVNAFMESLRTELLHSGVHVLTACPGFTASNIRNTALNAQGQQQGESPRAEEKMMSAEDVAQRIVLAVHRRKRDLVLTSQGRLTAFLNKWVPGLMDHLVYKHMAKEKDSPLV